MGPIQLTVNSSNSVQMYMALKVNEKFNQETLKPQGYQIRPIFHWLNMVHGSFTMLLIGSPKYLSIILKMKFGL